MHYEYIFSKAIAFNTFQIRAVLVYINMLNNPLSIVINFNTRPKTIKFSVYVVIYIYAWSYIWICNFLWPCTWVRRHKWKNILHVSEKVLNSKIRIQFNSLRENNLSKFKLIWKCFCIVKILKHKHWIITSTHIGLCRKKKFKKWGPRRKNNKGGCNLGYRLASSADFSLKM